MTGGALQLPAWMETAFTRYKTAEVSTVSKRGAPSTAPLSVIYQPERGTFLTTTAVAFPQKAYNLKRDPTASILYSYAAGSGLGERAPIVLVQGRGEVHDDLAANRPQFEAFAAEWGKVQPSFDVIWRSAFWRWAYRYYLLRVFITIAPERMIGWADGDLTKRPTIVEVAPPPERAAGVVGEYGERHIPLPAGARRRLEHYSHGVLSVRDREDGSIASVPCQCRATMDDGTVIVHIAPGVVPPHVEPYPASLCFHKHDERLSDLGQQLCTGVAMVSEDGTVSFHPDWQAGFELPKGVAGRALMGVITRAQGPKYFRGRPGPTSDMIPRPS